ncbi:hypothetical protein NDU88_000560 [Pleurodeles waltl]|uniref:Uncharacterized protein n=1 Tax=Pleurodeles waltl TaxID=8319 RepID=A0AAV7S7I9_PLEWA|nr:hypothetical protein NDU88_000560 [Pleurodeles waltl]
MLRRRIVCCPNKILTLACSHELSSDWVEKIELEFQKLSAMPEPASWPIKVETATAISKNLFVNPPTASPKVRNPQKTSVDTADSPLIPSQSAQPDEKPVQRAFARTTSRPVRVDTDCPHRMAVALRAPKV